ncbi:MAG: PP2C family protein-serine/threonine phosphatase [Blastocatellia bacterium]|nr:PP2C family protein-serine/threonine phosphatase [Blastocatellia bacterium]
MKRLRENLPKQMEAALSEHARLAERWAGIVRLIFAIVSAGAALRLWDHHSNAGTIYLALAIVWTAAWILGRLLVHRAVDSGIAATTLLDVTIVNLGLVAFVSQGLFPQLGAGLFLCYFPILAVVAARYRTMLLLIAAAYASLFYLALSLYAGSPPWWRLAMFGASALALLNGTRRPKDLVVGVAGAAIEDAYSLGAKEKELELTAQVHQLFLPPPIVDLHELWSSSKHGAGTHTGGDYYHLFETPRGPLVAIGDFGGEGMAALADVAALHKQLEKIVARESTLTGMLGALNAHIYEKYQGRRLFPLALAQWRGDEMRYANAGHLPAIHISKQDHRPLPATSGALGVAPDASFTEEVVPFPARDLLVLYTDGVFAKLTTDRARGVAEVESFAEKFGGGEVTTLCHRIFDCAQPGFDLNKDDATVVVVRRQPFKAEESKQAAG